MSACRSAAALSFALLAAGSFLPPLHGQPAPVPLACGPDDVLPDEATPVYVYGQDFTFETVIAVEGVGPLRDAVFVTQELIAGYTPPLDPDNPNHPPGWKDVSARNLGGGPTSVLANGVRYVGYDEPYLKHCWPSEVSPQGGTLIHFYGRRFREGLIPTFEGIACTDPVVVSESEMTAISPPLEPRDRYQFYTGEIIDGEGGPVVTRRYGALAVYADSAAPVLTSVEPIEVDARGGSFITIRGDYLRNDGATALNVHGPGGIFVGGVGGRTLDEQFLIVESIAGVSPVINPHNPETPLGLYDLVYNDLRGESLLAGALRYVDHIRTVSPSTLAADGGTAVVFDGYELEVDWIPRIGGVPCTEIVYESAERMLAVSPALPPGAHDADMTNADGTEIVATLPQAFVVEASAVVTLSSVEPTAISSLGGATVTFTGTGFHPGLTPRLGGVALLSPTFVDSERFAGTAPDFPFAGSLVEADLIDVDGNVVAALPEAVLIEAPPLLDAELLLGPSQGAGALAEGTARFEWVNPAEATAIHVFDINGAPVTTLAGGSRRLEVPVDLNVDQVPLFFQAELPSGIRSNALQIIARRSSCQWPPPLTGIDRKGDVELVLYGGNFLGEPGRCEAVNNFALLPDLVSLGIRQVRESYSRTAQGDGGGGDLLAQASIITSYTRSRLAEIAAVPELNYVRRLTTSQFTGFRLERDADALHIEAFYSMPVYAFGLKLKGRLIQAYPQDGFQDTFTFPDIEPTSVKSRRGVTYFRADRDVLDPDARACGLKIPAGDYVLELYAEGGDPATAHFIFETDGRNEEIVIPGVPCPPYPRVKVTNLTGLRSLPTITKVTGRQLLGSHPESGQPMVQLTAHGYWVDENGEAHSLDPADADSSTRRYVPHNFIFCWRVYDGSRQPRIAEISGSSNLVTPVRTIGCYRVDIRVDDPDCPPAAPCDGQPTRSTNPDGPRNSTITREVVVFPLSFVCNAPYYSLLNPVPDPATVSGVAGLSTLPPGLCTLPRRSEVFKLFVVPRDCCSGDIACPAVQPVDLEFRLTSGGAVVYTVDPNDVEDLCQDIQQGPKYLGVTIDFDRIALLPGGGAGRFVDVWLEGRTRQYRDPAFGGVPRDVNPDDNWRAIGSPMRLTNRPAVMTTSYSQVSYSPQTSLYQIVLQSSEQALHKFGQIPSSANVPLFSGIAGAEIPPFPSSVNAGMNTALQIAGAGAWKPADAASSLAGEVLGNAMDGLPSMVPGSELRSALPENLEWHWSQSKTILSTHFQQQLFQAILFTGTIGPIPVTVWGSVSLALGIDILAAMRIDVTPFAPLLDGGAYFKSQVDFRSKLKLSLPAELRTDILFGVASLTLSLIVGASANFDVTLRAINTDLDTFLRLYTKLEVSLGAKLCLFWFLCLPRIEIPLVEKTILDHSDPPGFGGGVEAGAGGGAASGPTITELLSVPASAVSPGGDQLFSLFYNAAQGRLLAELSTLQGDGGIRRENINVAPAELSPNGPVDVAMSYVTASRVLIAVAATYPNESAVSIAIPTEVVPPRAQLNELKAQDEIVLCRFDTSPGNGSIDSRVVRLADPPGEVAPADRRADGRPAIAGNARYEDALVAWVRIEDREYLVEDGTETTVYEPSPGPGGVTFTETPAPTTRARLETAAIYVRAVDFDGPLDLPRKISAPGINLQPAIAFAPGGDTAYCVWIHDPIHVDLIRSNRGRNLVYSVWTRAADAWSAPQPVLADPDAFPGVLEPSLALRGDGRGLLVFNALPADAPPQDTGLNGANRFVFVSRLENGQFGPPVRVHGVCARPVVARHITLHVDPLQVPRTGPINPEIYFQGPDYILIGQQTGALGSPEASGNILVAAIQEASIQSAVAWPVLSDNRTHTNVVGAVWQGGISTLNLKGGPAQIEVGGGAGGGVPEDIGYEPITVALEPDLAIVSCKLSDQFPGPGALVMATVEVENRGLAGSAMDSFGQSLTAVRLVYTRADGTETTQADAALPVLAPGERTTFETTLEMPLDPVHLRAEITSSAADRDPSNDAQGCYFGAPPPAAFECSVQVSTHESQDLLVELRWQSFTAVDEILLWRDGQPLAALPGEATLFVDEEASPGLHTYEIRSRVGVSKSRRVTIECNVVPPGGEGATFRRGDVDAGGRLDITDAIKLLGYLFLGSSGPACPDAADADDNGRHEITDAIVILGYLFLGSAPPPAPGPDSCGEDLNEDDLEPCAAVCE